MRGVLRYAVPSPRLCGLVSLANIVHRSPEQVMKTTPSLLQTLFLHHDGLVVGATVRGLNKNGLLDELFHNGQMTMGEILARNPAGRSSSGTPLRAQPGARSDGRE